MSKNSRNKFLTGAITATMVATAVVPVAAAEESASSKFTDIKNYAQSTQDKINALVAADIIKGTSETTFSPAQHITRGQVVKLLGRYLVEAGIAEAPADWETKERFTDLPVTFSDKDLVKNAAIVFEAGVFQGNNGVLNSAGEITRENMALVLDRAAEAITGVTLIEAAEGLENNVTDLGLAKDEAKEAIQALNALEISTVEKFMPKNSVQRVHFATFLSNAIEVIEEIEAGDEVEVELEVKSITAITTTGVEVTFPEITEALEEANVVVVDGEGNVVPTEAKLLAEGETSAEFSFTTPFKVDYEFTGVWTVNGKEYSFDAIHQLEDIREAVKAGNQIALQEAFDASGVEYANETRIASYLAALQEEGATDSLAAIQKAITKVDEDAVKEADKKAAVEAVVDAKTQAQLLSALQANFNHVNPEWIVNYANGSEDRPLLGLTVENNFDAEEVFTNIQDAIYTTNFAKVTPKVEAANMSLDSKKVSEARTLVTRWIPAGQEDEASIKEWVLDGLNIEDALIAVNNAKTNSALKSALTSLASLEESLVGKYKDVTNIVDYKGEVAKTLTAEDKEKKFDIKSVKNENLTAYRNAIANVEDVKGKNQLSDIQSIITQVNEKAIGDAKAEVLKDLNAVTGKTAAADVVALLEQNQKLNELDNKVNADYAESYKTAVVEKLVSDEFADADAVDTLVEEVNNAQDAEARLVAVNTASTAAEMSKALIALEAAETDATAFTNLSSTAKLEVAEMVIATRDELTNKKFADKDAALDAVTNSNTGAINVRTKFLESVIEKTDIAGMRAVLAGENTLLPEFAKLGTAAQTDAAESVLNALAELRADDKEGETSNFTSIAQIREAAGL